MIGLEDGSVGCGTVRFGFICPFRFVVVVVGFETCPYLSVIYELIIDDFINTSFSLHF